MKKKLLNTLFFTTLSAMALAGNAQAVLYDFYVSTTDRTTSAAAFVDYQYNTVTGTASAVGTYNLPSGVVGSLQDARSTLSISGDKNVLAWTGFATGTNVITVFNLTSKTFDTSTRFGTSAYTTAWTQSGSSIYLGGITAAASPGVVTLGGSSATQLRSATYSVDTIRDNNNHLFLSRNTANSTVGVYRADTAGQITSASTWTQLTGTGWTRAGTNVYAGFDFLSTDTLVVANNLTNTIEVYRSADPSQTTNWNLYTSLDLTSLMPGSGDLQQLSLLDLGGNNAQLFFTSGDGTTSTFGTVSWNFSGTSWSFGTASILGTSTSTIFQGVAAVAVIPEPATVGLCALGAGLVLFGLRRSRSRAR